MVFNPGNVRETIKSFWPRASRDDGYEGSWVEFLKPYYCVWMEIGGKKYAISGDASMWELADHIRNARKVNAANPDSPEQVTIGYRKMWTTERELLCPWCGVRPDRWEWDCDGQFPMASCGSEKCDQLKRCDGCGADRANGRGEYRYGTAGGHFCEECYTKWRCYAYNCPCENGGECRYNPPPF